MSSWLWLSSFDVLSKFGYFRINDCSSGVDEYGLIELQGELIDKAGDHLSGKIIGDLHFTKQVRYISVYYLRMILFLLLVTIFFMAKLSHSPNH